MEIVSDLHLHSKYSRAVSPSMTLPVMAEYAIKKGINLLTAADWTHPVWLKEMKTNLEEASEGIYRLKKSVIPNASTSLSVNSVEGSLANSSSRTSREIPLRQPTDRNDNDVRFIASEKQNGRFAMSGIMGVC